MALRALFALFLLLGTSAYAEKAPPSSVARKVHPVSGNRFHFYGQIATLSWQDVLTLTGPSSTGTLFSTSVGFCLGGGMSRAVTSRWVFDLGACGILATSEAGVEDAGASLSYSARNVLTYGVHATPGFYWVPRPRVAIGVNASLLLQVTNWPLPTTGYSMGGNSAFLYGVLFDARVGRGRFDFNPKMGFLKSLNRFFWSVGLIWRFS